MATTKLLLTDLASSVSHVPSNYIRPISDRPNLSDVQTSDDSIPLIDLQGLYGSDHYDIVKQIGQACQQNGFFQVPIGYIRLTPIVFSYDCMPCTTHFCTIHDIYIYMNLRPSSYNTYMIFQVKNHGVPETLINKIMCTSRDFFKLPESERLKNYSDDPSKTTRLSTSFNVKTEKVSNWRDFLRLHCYPLEDYVHEWPSNPPSFRCPGDFNHIYIYI